MPPRSIPRLVIAGVSSGTGKTTVTVGLSRALRARGLSVASFKCGPDYLDPTWHRRATGRTCHALDGWMMGRSAVLQTLVTGSADADIVLIEGVMGLFDGSSSTSESGSTAEIAKWLDAPVVVCVDARGIARTINAVAHGMAGYDPELNVVGLVANRVGSENHLDLLRKARPVVPVLGGLPRSPDHELPERHRAGGRHRRDAGFDARGLGGTRLHRLDVDRLLDLARAAPPIELPPPATTTGSPSGRVRIALACDEAFSFYYPDNLARLEQLGAELIRFSPVHDECVPEVDGLYIGGGYPELHARELSANESMRKSVQMLVASGAPVYAECGGLMLLAQALHTIDGTRHEMFGVIGGECHMRSRPAAIGYVEVETGAPSILGPAGLRFRGHQFRYSDLDPEPAGDHLYALRRRRGRETVTEGYGSNNVLASYVHAHWASNPRVASGLVSACAEWRAKRNLP